MGIQPNTTILFYRKIRQVIYHHLALQAHEVFDGKIKLDKRSLTASGKENEVSAKLKRGREAAEKITVFSMPKRQGKVYTIIVDNTQTKILLTVVINRKKIQAAIYTDCYHSDNILDVSEFKHRRINHQSHFSVKKNHINSIETIGIKQTCIKEIQWY